jgi:hypothetical protein
MKACSQWRERNPQLKVIVPATPPAESPTVDTSPADPRECEDPPPRMSDSYWSYIEACGCGKLDPPSRASLDYDRFMKACSQWRERNPRLKVIAPDPNARSRPTPTPPPKAPKLGGS